VVFSSVAFIFYFLPLFLLLYYFCGARNGALLFGSLVFYTWGEGAYLFLLAGLVALNFWIGLQIDGEQGATRKAFLIAGVTVNLAALAFFKYAGFLVRTIDAVTGAGLPAIEIHLPIGISFFVFQLISYLVDIGRGSLAADSGFVRFATYVMMFPHLIAGPIVRYSDIDRELFKRTITLSNAGLGVQYFIVGLCQKVVIANIVAPAADKVFAFPASELSAAVAWLGVTAYTLQIYFDFCGYSNMAIGLAFMLGFRFPINFNYPYVSRSITEFWRRWHMSLSFWFRDYVYIALGGNRNGPIRTYRNLIIVFFLTGLWHGASWTFVVWGLFHGAFLMIERAGLRKALDRSPAIVGWAYTMLVVMVGWVLFKATDMHQARTILAAMFGAGSSNPTEPMQLWLTPEIIAAMLAGILFSAPVLPTMLERLKFPALPGPVIPGTAHMKTTLIRPIPVILLVCGLCLSCALLISSNLNPFLYFQF
jgi:alginate O-acetyltransferase complex protein AlgI